MKYELHLQQKIAADNYPTLSLKDLSFLDWLSSFAHSGQMAMKIHNGRPYYWVYYPTVIKELPLLKWTNPDSVYRSAKKMCRLKILLAHPDNKRLSESYFGFGPGYLVFITSDAETGKKTGLTPEKKPVQDRKKNRSNTNIIEQVITNKGLTLDSDLEKCIFYLEKKKATAYFGQVVDVVDYFREITGKTRTGYGTESNISYLVKRFKEGVPIEDVQLVIDYKTWYFTEKMPSPDNINLDTFLRDSKFGGNLEKAREWKEERPVEMLPEDWKQSENNEYTAFMEWYWQSEILRRWPFSEAEYEKFIAGQVQCSILEEYPQAEKRVKILKRAIDQLLVRKSLPEPNGRRLVDIVVNHINQAVKSKK